MAYTMNDFLDAQENSLQDFLDQPEVQEAMKISSPSSDRNTASYTALLNAPTNTVQAAQTFNKVSDEYALTGTSQTHTDVLGVRANEEQGAYQREAAKVIIDPNVSTEAKLSTINYVNNPSNAAYGTYGLTLSSESSLPNDGATIESASLRGVAAAGIEQALDYMRLKQRVVNEHALTEKESGSLADWGAIGESIVPLMDGYKAAKAKAAISASVGGESSGVIGTAWNVLLPGQARANAAEQFNSLPLEQRMQLLNKVSETIANEGKTILLPSDMDRGNLAALQDVIDSGSYTLTEQTIDNVFGVLDVVGVGALLRKGYKAVKAASSGKSAAKLAAEEATDMERAIARRSVVDSTQPASPSSLLKDANPQKQRELHYVNEQSPDDSVSMAVNGTDREGAIASNLAPQPVVANGSVQSKTYMSEKYSDFDAVPSADVIDFVSNTSAPHLSIAEKRALRANTVNDFQNVSGMVNRKEMTTIGELDGGLNISAVYGATDSGWSNIQDAVEHAKYALRNYNIDESNIDILMRTGEDYQAIPKDTFNALMKGNNTQIKGDYLLRINQKYDYNSGDLREGDFEKFGVSSFFNFFNRSGWFSGKTGQGSLTSSVIDPSVLFNPQIMKGAQLADMKADALSAKMLEKAQPFIDVMKSVKQDRRLAMENMIRKGNLDGIDLNPTYLKSEGFSAEEIRGFNSFRKVQDTLWKLTNDDLVKTYKRQGYGRLTHKESGLDVIVKELPARSVPNNTRVYDPLTDTVRTMTREDINAEYALNKNIVSTHSPLNIDGHEVEHILNANHQSSIYVKALQDGESVMAYRKGYYAVRYKDPHFIMQKIINPDTGKVVRDEHGNEKWKAVATAANIPDAKAMIERLKSTKGGEYEFRNNMKGEDFDKAYTQMHTAGGLSAQRVRGQRLEDSSGINTGFGAHIDSPAESMLRSINAIASRVSYRDWIETNKQRLFAAYKDSGVFPIKEGQATYPSNVSEIVGHSKDAADVRATFEYIRAMENGYWNAVDAGWKAAINLLADVTGNAGFGMMEQGARALANKSPIAGVKGVAFTQMIALNPLRQLVLQGGQAATVLSRFPSYTTRIVQDTNLLLMTKMNKDLPEAVYKAQGRSKEEFLAMMKAMDESGVNKGISNHDIVRGIMDMTVDESIASMKQASKAMKVAKVPVKAVSTGVKYARKIGFDAGEWYVQSASYMAHYDDAVKKGLDVSSKAVKDDIAYQARNFTGNFSRSGTLAITQNAAAIPTMYLQVPLKMMGLLFNKGIPKAERAKIAAVQTLFYGAPSSLGAYVYNAVVPEGERVDGFERQLVEEGLATAGMNALISHTFGVKSNIDFGGALSPYDPSGFLDLAVNLGEAGVFETLAKTPAGSLMFSNNPRITNLAVSFGRALGFGEVGETTSFERWATVANDVAKLSSGYSNITKALQALEYEKNFSAAGTVTMDNITTPEAYAKALGFNSLSEVHKWDVMEESKKGAARIKKEVLENYNYFDRVVRNKDLTVQEAEYQLSMLGQMMSVYKDNPYAQKVFMDEMVRRAKEGDLNMLEFIRKHSGWANAEELESMLNKSGLPENQKQLLRKYFNPDLSETEQ